MYRTAYCLRVRVVYLAAEKAATDVTRIPAGDPFLKFAAGFALTKAFIPCARPDNLQGARVGVARRVMILTFRARVRLEVDRCLAVVHVHLLLGGGVAALDPVAHPLRPRAAAPHQLAHSEATHGVVVLAPAQPRSQGVPPCLAGTRGVS